MSADLTRSGIPWNGDAEKGVLCSAMLQPECMEELGDLTGDHFFDPTHMVIWECLKQRFLDRKPIDLISISDALRDLPVIKGNPACLAEISIFIPTAANVIAYASILREKAMRRSILSAANETARLAIESMSEPHVLLNEVEARWLQLRSGTRAETSLKHIESYVMEAIDGIESTYKNRGKCVGLPTMTTDFDRMTGGLRPGQMVVVAGRPGMGKSALSVQWATAMAEAGFPVAVFSLEMTGVDLASRMICTEMPLDLKRVRDGFMNKSDMQRMPVAASKIGGLPLHIDETPSLNIFDFRGRARRAVVKHGVKCIVVDYLQLMRSTSKRAQENRAYEVAEISMALKATAKELGVPVIAATQLGRNAEERSAPKLADLRESGQIEQDADIVVMLHRPKKGLKDKDTGESLDDGSVELIVAKQRNGPVGTVNLQFEAEYTRFNNVTEQLYSNNKEKRQKH
jgi:replicative DNA helicase